MNMLRMMKTADYFTLANLAAGIAAVFYFLMGNVFVGSLLILLAMVLDFLDGKIARALKQQNAFGKELDSLADLISFGVAPAVMMYAITMPMSSLQASKFIPLYVLFVCAGALRLARFNVTDVKGFEGMPITVNGVLFPLMYFVNVPPFWMLIVMGVSAVLMVSSIRFRKI